MRIKDIDDARVIVVVASDTENDVPIVNLRIKKAVSKRGAKLIVVHPEGVDLDRASRTVHIRNTPGGAAAEVRKLAVHELLKNPGGLVAILFGDGHGSEDINDLATACGDLAEKVGGKEMPLYRGTNERGALAAGVAGLGQPRRRRGAPQLGSAAHRRHPRIGEVPRRLGPPAAARVRQAPRWCCRRPPSPSSRAATRTSRAASSSCGRRSPFRPPLRESWEVLHRARASRSAWTSTTSGIFPLQREAASSTRRSPTWPGRPPPRHPRRRS